ncbi:MAG: GC-type dockerin domain-anchored protein [Phycisphaerales bacterium]
MKLDMRWSVGAVIALAGSSAGAQMIDWAAPVDGDWSVAANWSGSNVPNVAGEDAVLGLSGAYTVFANSNFGMDNLFINNTLATLAIEPSRTLTVFANMVNDGTVIVNSNGTVFNSALSFTSDASITGSGSVMMMGTSQPEDAQVVSNGFTLTHGAGHTIHGSGLINGVVINNGTILADDPLGSGLRISGTMTNNGMLGADAGTLILGNSSLTTGGSIDAINGGSILVDVGTARVGDLTINGDLNITGSGEFLSLESSIVNNGVMTVNSSLQIFNAHLQFLNDSTIGGTGEVVLNAVDDINDAQILTSDSVLGTIGAGQTVRGSGLIDGVFGGTIINLGIINADDPAFELSLRGNHIGGGEYRADGGEMDLANTLSIQNAIFDSSGGGFFSMSSTGDAVLNSVVNNGELRVLGSGGFLTLTGPLTNNGTIILNSNQNIFNAHIRNEVETVIDGNGIITMISDGNINDAQIITTIPGFDLTLGVGQVVEGAGLIGTTNGGAIVNLGTINANQAAVDKVPARELRLLGLHSGGGEYRSDDGLLGLGSNMMLTGGTLETTGAGQIRMGTSGTATFDGVVNNGDLGIDGSGSFIALDGPLTNNGTLTINSNSAQFNAHLIFNASTTLDGTGETRLVTIGDPGDAQLFTNGDFVGTIGSSQTVAGQGIIDGRNDGTIVNLGVINADDPAGTLRLQGNHDGSMGGEYRADGGTLGLVNGLNMIEGDFDTSGDGVVEMLVSGIATLHSAVNDGEMAVLGAGGFIDMVGGIVNNGNIALNSNQNIFNAHLRFVDTGTISGVGTIEMQTATGNNDAQIIASSGVVGTIGAGQSVSGDGLLVGELVVLGGIDPAGLTRALNIDIMSFGATTSMTADLGGLANGEFDRLVLSGADTIVLDGSLTVNLDDGYVPQFLDQWDIVDGGSVTGEFSSITFPPSPAGLDYKVIYQSNRAYVILTCAADLTGDGDLNFLDVSAFLGFFGSNDVRGDINGDGSFNFLDVSLFLNIFSGTCAG